MTADAALLEALAACAAALRRVGRPAMIIGGIAVIARGLPRQTVDIDATIWAEGLDIDAILPTFAAEGLVPGQAVGRSDTAGGEALHAFSWTQAGGMVDLGTLGGSYGSALAVNDAGQAVGESRTAGDEATHAFSWTQASGMVDLGTLGGSWSVALAVNEAGQAVGRSDTAGDAATHAALWEIATLPSTPSTRNECRNGGWKTYGVFKNQGDCVSFVATRGKNPPG